MFRAIQSRWQSRNGYKEVLLLAIPLIVTTCSGSVQSFIDRIFLANLDSNALAATVPAAMICFSFIALFMGTAGYVSVFVAQHFGAGDDSKVGASVWQGFYIIAPSLLVVIPVFVFVEPIYAWIGHDPIIQIIEAKYTRVLILSVPIMIVSACLTGFFSGIGRTPVVMWSTLLVTILNLILDYGLIFGNWGMPKMGVEGAAWATVISLSVGAAVQLWIFLSAEYRQRFATHLHWWPNGFMFKRLLRFGLPLGIQAQVGGLATTVFVLLIGKIGIAELTAHSIAMNIFMLAIMPVGGLTIAVSVLVGQRLGSSDPDGAERVTYSAMHLAAIVFVAAGLMLAALPAWFTSPFSQGMSPSTYAVTVPLVHTLLRMLSVVCLFQAVSGMMTGALSGAGDTRFIAGVGIAASWLLLVLPTALLNYFWGGHLLWSWGFFLINGFFMCLVCWFRFRAGKWKLIRVVA